MIKIIENENIENTAGKEVNNNNEIENKNNDFEIEDLDIKNNVYKWWNNWKNIYLKS